MRCLRGQQCLFEKLLVNHDGTKIQPGKQVSVRVLDPNGKIVYVGQAQFNLDLNSYSFIFIVPQDAMLSTGEKSWTVDWSFVDEEGHVIDIVVEFDVVREDHSLPEQTILLNEKSELETVTFHLPDRPTSFELVAFDSANMEIFKTRNPEDFNITPTDKGVIFDLRINTYTFRVPPKEPVQRQQPHVTHAEHWNPDDRVDETQKVFDSNRPKPIDPDTPVYYGEDFTNLHPQDTYVPYQENYMINHSAVGDYLFRLTARIPNRRGLHVENVLVRIVPNNFWRLYPSLQIQLDRARKRPDMINSYSDSDYYEAICRGIAMINIAPPQVTNWVLEDFPLGGRYWGQYDLSHFLLAGAGIWLLQAQTVAYGEIGFQFTGQTVTLDYDPSGNLGGVIESWLNEINLKLPRAKNLIVKATHRTAHIGIRQQFYNHQLSRLDIFRRGLGYAGIVNAPMIGARFLF